MWEIGQHRLQEVGVDVQALLLGDLESGAVAVVRSNKGGAGGGELLHVAEPLSAGFILQEGGQHLILLLTLPAQGVVLVVEGGLCLQAGDLLRKASSPSA